MTLEGDFGKHWTGFVEGVLALQGIVRDQNGDPYLDRRHGYNGGLYRALSRSFLWNIYGGISVNPGYWKERYGKLGYSFGTGLTYRLVPRRNR